VTVTPQCVEGVASEGPVCLGEATAAGRPAGTLGLSDCSPVGVVVGTRSTGTAAAACVLASVDDLGCEDWVCVEYVVCEAEVEAVELVGDSESKREPE
jgi:hypothetical protein